MLKSVFNFCLFLIICTGVLGGLCALSFGFDTVKDAAVAINDYVGRINENLDSRCKNAVSFIDSKTKYARADFSEVATEYFNWISGNAEKTVNILERITEIFSSTEYLTTASIQPAAEATFSKNDASQQAKEIIREMVRANDLELADTRELFLDLESRTSALENSLAINDNLANTNLSSQDASNRKNDFGWIGYARIVNGETGFDSTVTTTLSGQVNFIPVYLANAAIGTSTIYQEGDDREIAQLKIELTDNDRIIQINSENLRSAINTLGFIVSEQGVLEVKTLKTQKLCVGDICVTQEQFEKVFGEGGASSTAQTPEVNFASSYQQ
jgi:hypothetical protein